ncbi:MAG: amidohydrolase [Candidatus Binatia bacterium]
MTITSNKIVLISLFFLLAACGGHEVDFARSLAVKAPADLVLRGGKIVTVDRDFSIQQAVAIKDGRFLAVGTERDMRPLIGPGTTVIELAGRTVIPGLIDSHIHATVAGLSWDAELHWQFTRTLADGLTQIGTAAKAKSPGSWIVVGGGWVPTQFAERRFPTRADLDVLAPNHPVYIQYLRQGALLNSAALAAAGITRQTPDPVGGKFERNPNTGDLTGWLQGAPAWEYAYDKIPQLTLDKVRQSLRNCFRELNRWGITSISDLQTGGVNFAHRRVLADMARSGELSLRINFYVAPNEAGGEIDQLKRAAEAIKSLHQDDMFRFAGFTESSMRGEGVADSVRASLDAAALEKFRRLARFFAEGGYNFHLHAAGDKTARRLLDVLEQVHSVKPFTRQRIAFADVDDVTPETIARIKNLGGAVAVQNRMALTGERSVALWGLEKARNAPPLRALIESGIPLSAGSDAFRAGNYSPMMSLWWLIAGKTLAGSALRNRNQNLTRQEALRMHTMGGAWLTFEEGRKGSIEAGKYADLAVLNGDYLTVAEEQIRALESLLTLVGGRVVYAAGPFAQFGRN